MITRRGLIAGLGVLLAAPAIVRASSLMPLSVWRYEPRTWYVSPETIRSGDGSAAHPFRTIAEAAVAAARDGGGTVMILAGVHQTPWMAVQPHFIT